MEKYRTRLLLVLKVLIEETDIDHPISMHRIRESLLEHGLDFGRKCIYTDIKDISYKNI